MFYIKEQTADSECTQTMADNISNNTFFTCYYLLYLSLWAYDKSNVIIVYRMEFTRWSCQWNSDQNCRQNSTWGLGSGVGGG